MGCRRHSTAAQRKAELGLLNFGRGHLGGDPHVAGIRTAPMSFRNCRATILVAAKVSGGNGRELS